MRHLLETKFMFEHYSVVCDSEFYKFAIWLEMVSVKIKN